MEGYSPSVQNYTTEIISNSYGGVSHTPSTNADVAELETLAPS